MTKNYYDQMSATVAPFLRQQWEREIARAESLRLENPNVMEVLAARCIDPDSDPGPSREYGNTSGLTWLTLALSIEEKQSVFWFITDLFQLQIIS